MSTVGTKKPQFISITYVRVCIFPPPPLIDVILYENNYALKIKVPHSHFHANRGSFAWK